MMKTFGLVVPAGKGSKFEEHVHSPLAGHPDLAPILLPLVGVWRSICLRAAEFSQPLVADARTLPKNTPKPVPLNDRPSMRLPEWPE